MSTLQILEGIAPIVTMFVAYAVAAIVVNIMAQPVRLKMVELGEDLLANGNLSHADRAHIEARLNTSMSTLVAALIPIAVIGASADVVLKRPLLPPPNLRVARDARYHRFMGYYVISLLASNLLIGAVSAIAMLAFLLLKACFGNARVREAIEIPANMAADRACPALG